MNTKYKIKYILECNPDLYEVYNPEGRLLMFFRIKRKFSEPFGPSFIESNIDFDHIDNAVVSYCVLKLEMGTLEINKTELYINKIIERILPSENGQAMFIASDFLDTQGKLKTDLYEEYQKVKKRIWDNLENYVELGVPYTTYSHPIFMDIINVPWVHKRIKSGGKEITKEVFEKNIPNEKVGLKYIDLFYPEAIFYSQKNVDDDYTSFTMMIKENVELVYIV